jgi:hypothetical protein
MQRRLFVVSLTRTNLRLLKVCLPFCCVLPPSQAVLLAQKATPSGGPYLGGDKSPLTWSSSQKLVQAGTANALPVYGYDKTVENHSKQDVTDVYWPVAGYEKKILPAGIPLTDHVTLPGDLQIPQPKGDLYYGVGKNSYKTAVYAPKDGWSSSGVIPTVTHALTAQLQVAILTVERHNICTVRLSSDVSKNPAGNGFEYHYELANIGSIPIRVFWNIPGSETFREQFKQSEKDPFVLPPERPKTQIVKLNQAPAMYRTTVFISTTAGELIGRSIVGVWAAENAQRPVKLEDEWKQ